MRKKKKWNIREGTWVVVTRHDIFDKIRAIQFFSCMGGWRIRFLEGCFSVAKYENSTTNLFFSKQDHHFLFFFFLNDWVIDTFVLVSAELTDWTICVIFSNKYPICSFHCWMKSIFSFRLHFDSHLNETVEEYFIFHEKYHIYFIQQNTNK